MVDAPLELEAVVRALANVPEEIADAFNAVMFAPLNVAVADPVPPLVTARTPDVTLDAFNEVSAEPDPLIEVDVIAAAAKFPLASLATIVLAPFADAAVVLAFANVPEEMLEAFMDVTLAPDPFNVPIKLVAETL